MDLEPETLEQAVRREIVLPVDRQAAWSRLADAAGLQLWLADEVKLEIRRGAQGTVRWRDGSTRLVEVEEVEHMRRICLLWREPDGEPSLVELTLDDVEQGTRLIVVEVPILVLRAVTRAVECESDHPHGPQMLAVSV